MHGLHMVYTTICSTLHYFVGLYLLFLISSQVFGDSD